MCEPPRLGTLALPGNEKARGPTEVERAGFVSRIAAGPEGQSRSPSRATWFSSSGRCVEVAHLVGHRAAIRPLDVFDEVSVGIMDAPRPRKWIFVAQLLAAGASL